MPITTFPVTVHSYLPFPTSKSPNIAYEYGIHPSASSNALIFIGGLGDGPHGIPYIRTIEKALSQSNLNYSVFELRLRSAYNGWGTSSLARDVREIAGLVRYLKGEGVRKRRVVIMGHSTGCQDCVAYLRELAKGEGEIPEVEGAILQGPVSDREAIGMGMGEKEFEESREVARGMVEGGRGEEFMRGSLVGEFRGVPVTARRWFGLVGYFGDDDFFSSDLRDEDVASVWNPLNRPVLVVPSAEDEHVPKRIDVPGLMGRWKGFCRPGVYNELSGVIPGANHRVDNPDGQEWLADRAVRFLSEVQSGIAIGELEGDLSNKRKGESHRGEPKI